MICNPVLDAAGSAFHILMIYLREASVPFAFPRQCALLNGFSDITEPNWP